LLAKLPARYREAIVLRHVEDLGYPEIAAVLRRPEGTIKSDVHRGLALLRAELAPLREEVTA
jgi:RNA polymerase sigma-70 factor, ECF subfamily